MGGSEVWVSPTDPTNWLPLVEGFGRHFHRVAGQPHSAGWQRFTSQSPHRFRAGRSELLS
jgi:hypothetical protein